MKAFENLKKAWNQTIKAQCILCFWKRREHIHTSGCMTDYSIYTYRNLKGCDLKSKSSNIQKQQVKIKQIRIPTEMAYMQMGYGKYQCYVPWN